MSYDASTDPHARDEILHAGVALEHAKALVVLLHGRGSDADDIIRLARSLPGDGVCYFAPDANGNEWYPKRFIAPLAENEPNLSSALKLVHTIVARAAKAGLARSRVVLGGFSQGACLALESASRLGGRFGGVFAFSGGIIGPLDAPRTLDRPLEGTPVFIGCSDIDAHIPVEKVHESTRVLTANGAVVTERIYPGLGHTIVGEEIALANRIIRDAVSGH